MALIKLLMLLNVSNQYFLVTSSSTTELQKEDEMKHGSDLITQESEPRKHSARYENYELKNKEAERLLQ